MGKYAFGHMCTAKVQISLRICVVWAGPSMSANWIIGHHRMHQWRTNAWWDCACVEWLRILHMLEDTFRLVRPILPFWRLVLYWTPLDWSRHRLLQSPWIWIQSIPTILYLHLCNISPKMYLYSFAYRSICTAGCTKTTAKTLMRKHRCAYA